jgi:hypothetical protein
MRILKEGWLKKGAGRLPLLFAVDKSENLQSKRRKSIYLQSLW